MNVEERKKSILLILKKYEEKYELKSEEFYRLWTSGAIPEPEDTYLLVEYLTWQDLIEELKELEKKDRK